MKLLVTKCVCDVCGREVNSDENRYMIAFGVGNWQDDMDISDCAANKKDMCRSCYETLRTLLGEFRTKHCSKPVEKPVKVARGDYDKDTIIELWRQGVSYNEIASRANCSRSNVNYVVSLAKKQGLMKYGDIRAAEKLADSDDGMKTVVDQDGLVLAIERV